VISGSLRHQRESHWAEAAAAVEMIARDLRCCAQSPSTNTPPFQLDCVRVATNVPGLATLALSVGSTPGADDDFSRLEIRRVGYSVARKEGRADGSLVRETMTLWGPDALALPESNVVAEGIVAFDVEVLAGSSWTNSWQSSAGSLIPQAARVRIDWRAADTTETAVVEVFIPAGNVVRENRPQTSDHRP